MSQVIDTAGVRQACLEIAKAETSRDYDKALKVANKLIRNYRKETYAFKCKLIALIQLEQLSEALDLIKKTPEGQMGNVSFEKAYILYRRNENDAALEELAKANQEEVGVIELKAQLFYRLERFEEARDLLRKLIREHSDDFDDQRLANLIAVEAQLQAAGVSSDPQTSAAETYEALFNVACHQIEHGKYTEAVKSLDKAYVLCKQALTEEGLLEDEIDEELATILVQKGFALQLLGKPEEALKIYVGVQEKNPTDPNAKTTLFNNLPTTRAEPNLADARKKLKAATQVDKSKLSKRQQRTLLFNQALISLLSNQREPCRRTLEELQAKYGAVNEAVLLETALLVRQKDIQGALATLGRAEQDVTAKLLKIQILINSGASKEALEALKDLPEEIRYAPAIAALVSNLNLAKNQASDAAAYVEKAAAYWAGKDAEKANLLLKKVATLATTSGDHDKAVTSLEKIYAANPEDTTVLCRLIKAYGAINSPKAQELITKLNPSVDDSELNPTELEENDWIIYGQRYKKKEGGKKDEFVDTEIVTGKLKKRNRKRKIILPKNYDPNVQPDPERWIPKQERAAYKKRLNKKFKDQHIGRGTQGAASGAASDRIDYSKNSPATHKSPQPTSPAAPEGPRQKGPVGQANKKKKPTKKGRH
uniref:Signal recognition particle subunit SRP72 n=1 Tax=Panagrellus redivivus TaxID=6233 RepID=A0A7E4VN07_PANRE